MTLNDAIESLTAYRMSGRPTGGFLRAVLCNDLMDAIGRADASSLDNLQAICRYVYHDMPMDCWGSSKKVERWVETRSETREVR